MRISDWSSDVCSSDLTSVLAIAALLAGRSLGWVWMPAAMGFVGAVVIARWSWGLMQTTAAVLVDAPVTGALEQELRHPIADGAAPLAALPVWPFAPGPSGAPLSSLFLTPPPPHAP